MMRMSSVAIAFVAFVAAATAAPLTASLAEPVISSPNAVNNATVDPAMTSGASAGAYNTEDPELTGFPLPGWPHVMRPPS